MYKIRFKKILNILLLICCFGIIFFVPVFFAVFPKTNNVFELNKIVLFKILTLFFFLFSFLKVVFFEKEKAYLVEIFSSLKQRKVLLLSSFLFFLSLLISTYFSINHQNSLYGLYDRQSGIDSLFFYFLFFISLLFNIRTEKQVINILKVATFSSLVAVFYGLVQATGHDLLNWSETTRYRIISTLGQPNILASYILLVYPFSVYLFFISRNLFFRILYLFIFTSQIITLLLTYSVSAWFSLVFGLFIFFVVFFKNSKDLLKRFLTESKKIRIPIFIFIVIIFFVVIGNIHSLYFFKDRVNSVFNPSRGSFAARIDFWQASWKAIKEKPVFGYGPENQGEIICRYYEKNWGIHTGVNVFPNRAHNLFLDILLTRGFFGLFAYLFLFYLFLRIILKNLKSERLKYLSYVILTSLVGYITSLQLNFSFVVGNVYLCLVLVIILLIDRDQDDIVCEKTNFKYSLKHRILLSFLSVLIAVFSIYSVSTQLKTLIADYYFFEIRQANLDDNFFEALTIYDYLKDLKIRDLEYDRRFAGIIIEWFPKLDKYGLIFRITAEKELKEILKEIDGNSREDYFTRAKIYTFLASGTEDENYDLAENSFKYLIDRYPGVPVFNYELAAMFQKRGEYESAINNYLISLSNLPSVDSLYLNSEHKMKIEDMMFFIYIGLGDSFLASKDFEQSVAYYMKSWDLNQESPLVYEKLSSYSKIKGDIDGAVEYNEKAWSIWEYDYAWPLEIAKLYKEKGDLEKAKEYGEIASGLSVNNSLVEDFLSSLNVKQ